MQFARQGALYSGLGDVLRKTIAADGLAGLWQGYSLNIVRTVPQCVITFTLYEWLQEWFHARLVGAPAAGASLSSAAARAVAESEPAMLVRTRSENRG